MMLARTKAEDYLATAIDAVRSGLGYAAIVDQLPVPIYLTDTDGAVTYWNQACVDFAGREPELGRDRWCVTWHLYTISGERLPHEQCPMAEAIHKRRAVRDQIAIAERPDRSRRAFRPYPTPLLDDDGQLIGAINMLIDVTDEQASALFDQSSRCRRLADATTDREASTILRAMARRYEETATALNAGSDVKTADRTATQA